MPFLSIFNICGLRTGPGKLFMGVLESSGKVLDFLSVKEWEPCAIAGAGDFTNLMHNQSPSH